MRYCWPTPFKVLEVLFLGEVCSAFLPSKKAYWTHQFQYLGVDQQYPSLFCDSALRSDCIAECGVLTGSRVRHITSVMVPRERWYWAQLPENLAGILGVALSSVWKGG